jgi:hypothetical protein
MMFSRIDLKQLLNSEAGKMIISVMLGLGLASLFRKVCVDKNCITFNGYILSDIEDKTYKYDETCYKYKAKPEKCDDTKKIVSVSEKKIDIKRTTDKQGSFLSPIESIFSPATTHPPATASLPSSEYKTSHYE